MVLKIPMAKGASGGDGRLADPRSAKKAKVAEEEGPAAAPTAAEKEAPADEEKRQPSGLCCAGCGVGEGAAAGPLLLFEDPEEDPREEAPKKTAEEEER